ncbi:hypothetical protein M9Y10_025945 [Tritrichomonas musculus]|uniref:Uncharacterized protein n=1 Tax=Tritrichomonas musculus TaxID=1915356 RepID=A0ABR2H858_9EUKA
MKYILLEHELEEYLGIDDIVPESRSDSGRNIVKEDDVELRPMIWYLKLAKRLWRNVTNFPRFKLLSKIKDNRHPMTKDELFNFIETFTEKPHLQISTKSTGMIKTAGLNGVAFWNAQKQMDDLVDDEE